MKYLFTKKVAFKFIDTISLLCTSYSIFAGKNVTLDILFRLRRFIFWSFIFWFFFWLKVVSNACITDYLKLTNKNTCTISADKLLKKAVSKHFDAFSWLQTPYFIWLLLMKLIYQTGVCLGQMFVLFVDCYNWLTPILKTISILHSVSLSLNLSVFYGSMSSWKFSFSF